MNFEISELVYLGEGEGRLIQKAMSELPVGLYVKTSLSVKPFI